MNATGEGRTRAPGFALAAFSLPLLLLGGPAPAQHSPGGLFPARSSRAGLTPTGLCLALLCLAGPSGFARAQDLVRFDPSRDLEGFDACFASEFRDLYPLDTYSEMLGKEMSAAALAQTRQRWKSDRAGGDRKLADLRADPREESLWLLRHRLAKSAYFSKIAWTEDRSFPGLVLLIQRPSKELPDYAANVAREHGPWLEKLSSVFEETYAKPLNLERPSSRALWAIAILASPGDYQNFWSIHPNLGPNAAWACYDPKLGLSIGYEDPFQPGVSSVDRRYPLLDAFARGMIDGYAISPEGRPGALWIEEGLANYLAYHEGTAPACLDERRIRPATLQAIVDMAQGKEWGRFVLHPIEDLVSIKSSEDIDNLVTRRSEAAAKPRPAERDVLSAFYGQSILWVHFFHAASDGAFREHFLKYLRWALSGEAGSGVLRLALDGQDSAAINREFLRWMAEEERRMFPEARVDTARIAALFGDRAGPSPPEPSPAGTSLSDGTTAAPPSPPPFSPSVLAVEASDVESRHGLALLQARAGDLEGAMAALKALSRETVAPDEGARVAHDIARLLESVKLRDAFLENLRSSGAKWSTEFEGKKLVLSVARVEGGFVHLAESRQGIAKIPLAALDPMEIAKQATKREQQGNSQPWARFYAYVLAEDARWEKLLKDSSDEARSLREDARTWYPARLRAGRAAAALNALSKAPLPSSGKPAEALCGTIRDLLVDFRGVPLLGRRMGDLKRLARAAAEASLADLEPASLLHAKWSPLEDGRVALAYEFDNEAEAQDFVRQPGYMKTWHKAFKLDVGKEEEASWTVHDGHYSGVGAGCYRLPLAFSAPMVVRYEIEVAEGKGEGKEQANFAVGLCDDRKENAIFSIDFGGLVIRDTPKAVDVHLMPEQGFSYVPGTSYKIEVHHEGARVSVWVDGEKTNESPCATRTSGDVFLWFHTNLPISIERFEIRGKADPASARALRAACAEKKLAEMGFP